jgi:hypothetical protein
MNRPLAAALIALAGVGSASVPAVAFAQDASQLRALMRPGSSVFGSSGKEVGVIESVDKKTFVMKTPDGPVTLSRGVISLGVKGLRIDKTTSQVRELAEAQAKATAS